MKWIWWREWRRVKQLSFTWLITQSWKSLKIDYLKPLTSRRGFESLISTLFFSYILSSCTNPSHQLRQPSAGEEGRIGENRMFGQRESESKHHMVTKEQHDAQRWVFCCCCWFFVSSTNVWDMIFSNQTSLSLVAFPGEDKLHSSTLSLESVDRHKGGIYICTANNGVGKPASSQVIVHVMCEYCKTTEKTSYQ